MHSVIFLIMILNFNLYLLQKPNQKDFPSNEKLNKIAKSLSECLIRQRTVSEDIKKILEKALENRDLEKQKEQLVSLFNEKSPEIITCIMEVQKNFQSDIDYSQKINHSNEYIICLKKELLKQTDKDSFAYININNLMNMINDKKYHMAYLVYKHIKNNNFNLIKNCE